MTVLKEVSGQLFSLLCFEGKLLKQMWGFLHIRKSSGFACVNALLLIFF